jgi:hypothetical protein
VAAAKGWLQTHFSAAAHPGCYFLEREALRRALYYYYACSVAQALMRAVPKETTALAARPHTGRKRSPRSCFCASVMTAQGSFREDDPLVATSFALRALAGNR